jgi:undecaprenyl-diphosphatase
MNHIQAIIIAIVEGLTEFLPISSTGHMIITQKLLGIESTDFVKFFTVAIQLGAILSVIVLYWKRFFQSMSFYYKLFVAFIPSMVFGLLLHSYIEDLLGNVYVVAFSLLIGGIILLFVDKWFKNNSNEELTYPRAFKVGMFQIISMIPGVSRSAATIIGGMAQKMSRKTAAEFSFFLAIPTMFGATLLELFKSYKSITPSDFPVLITGNVVAFIVAIIAIKGFIAFLNTHGFKIFGYYRIIVGVTILVLLFMGVDLNMAG